MKTAYLDCYSGISGDKFLGAMFDAGLDFDKFSAEIAKLNFSGYELKLEKTKKNGLMGTRFIVDAQDEKKHRHLSHINKIIDESTLSDSVKTKSKEAFLVLAQAEAKMHGTSIESVHFHEVGAVDSIIDIVGAFIALEMMGIEEVIASHIHTGKGFVKCMHGLIPVPAPATAEILKGIPSYSADIEGELTTPTGALLVKTMCSRFGSMPDMKVEAIGYGAGYLDFPIPNLLRIQIGEAVENIEGGYETDTVFLLETNIDDQSPEITAFACEKLFEAGALDVYSTPIYMKKGRTGVILSVICTTDKKDILAEEIFRHTNTFGIRISKTERIKLRREILTAETRFGAIGVKRGYNNKGTITLAPEFEHCREAAVRCNVPVVEVYGEALKSASISSSAF
ncbi:MAG: nickel pincer cofactor biosynthesis protein LarC [Firmicutes bacterium]|nr:nickel pincer cofactor biosynthesis protein LarC [Bacillota bacterium]